MIDVDPEDVQLSTAKSGVYEVVYVDSRSTFLAIPSAISMQANLSPASQAPVMHQTIYKGGLIAAFSCPVAEAAHTRGSVPHGYGTLLFEDTGECYEGEWKFGMRSGKGHWKGPPNPAATAAAAQQQNHQQSSTQQTNASDPNTSTVSSSQQQQLAPLPERASYEGEWAFDKKSGKGVETFLDGRNYVGEYQKGNCHGVGSLTFLNNDQYRGLFKEGVPHDVKGEYQFANGDLLTGPWVEGKRHGNFSVQYASSPQHSYQASFVNDAMTVVSFIS